MNRYEYSRRYRSRRRKRRLKRATVILGCAALFFICGTGAAVWGKKFLDGRFPLPSSATTAGPEASDALPEGLPGGSASHLLRHDLAAGILPLVEPAPSGGCRYPRGRRHYLLCA